MTQFREGLPADLLQAVYEQLRAIAKAEGVSLGEVMRQGLEWRVQTRRRPPSG